MNFRQLRYFIQVVENGSFTKASETIGVAQPSLGYQLRKLEDELGVQLLIRSSYGIRTTAAGRMLFDRGREIIGDTVALKQQIIDMGEVTRGQVALGLPPSLAVVLAIPLIDLAHREFSAVSISITEEMSNMLCGLVLCGDLDLALVYSTPPTRGLRRKRLASDHLCFVSARKTKDDGTTPITFDEIARTPLILPRKPQRLRQLAEDAARKRGIQLNVVFEMQSINMILRLVETGHGATLMPSMASAKLTREAALVSRKLVDPVINHSLSLIYADSRPLPRAGQAVAALAEAMVGQEMQAISTPAPALRHRKKRWRQNNF